MDTQFENVNCIICGSDDTEIYIQDEGPTQIVKCRNDEFLFLNPQPKSSLFKESFKEYVPNVDMFTNFRRDDLRREAGAIKQMKAGGNLLDVGCSVGTFFENFDKENWLLFGVDPSSFNARATHHRYGAEVFCGTLREASYPDAFFDVITILDTIYYFSDIQKELMEIRRCLKNDGLLVIEIQGLNYWRMRDKGLICWLLDRKWMRFDRGRLYYFSPSTIRQFLQSTGFQVIRVDPGQASMSRLGVARVLNHLHFALARLLFKATAGRFSIAAREIYLAVKAKTLTASCDASLRGGV